MNHLSAAVPRLIFWELTQRCNLRCLHCRAGRPAGEGQDLSLAQIEPILDDIAARYRPLLILTGGEPLLRPDLFDIAAAARRRGLPISLASNGTLIDAAMAQRIAAAGFQRAAISLDGAGPATHDRFRGQPGSFDAARSGIEQLRRAGLPFQVNFTVTRHNLDDFDALFSLAQSWQAAALHLFLLVPVGCGLQLAPELRLSPAMSEQVLERFFERSRQSPLETRVTCAPYYQRIVRQKGGGPLPAASRGCLAGSAVCFISHQGQVRPCGYFAATAGDLRQTPFAEIWEQSALFTALRDPGKRTGKCSVCEYADACSGCRARALGTSGNYLAEEPDCLYQPKKRGAV